MNFKLIVYLVLLAFLIGSACKEKQVDFPNLISKNSSERRLSFSDFYGVWVDTAMFRSFRNSVSPAQDLTSKEPLDLTIADTCILGWGYHEGISLVPDSMSNDKMFLKCIENPEEYSISLDIINDSALLCHNCVKGKTTILRKFAELKKENSSDCHCAGLPCYFIQKYFSGKFQCIDYSKPDSTFEVVFSQSCHVVGFRDYNQYGISFDDFGSFTNFDVISFIDKKSENYIDNKYWYYHYKLSQDSIYLYDFDPPYDKILQDTTNHIDDAKIGKLIYVFKKI